MKTIGTIELDRISRQISKTTHARHCQAEQNDVGILGVQSLSKASSPVCAGDLETTFDQRRAQPPVAWRFLIDNHDSRGTH